MSETRLDFQTEPAWIGWVWRIGDHSGWDRVGWAVTYRQALRAAARHGSSDAQQINALWEQYGE